MPPVRSLLGLHCWGVSNQKKKQYKRIARRRRILGGNDGTHFTSKITQNHRGNFSVVRLVTMNANHNGTHALGPIDSNIYLFLFLIKLFISSIFEQNNFILIEGNSLLLQPTENY
jgi:hypothetical protein